MKAGEGTGSEDPPVPVVEPRAHSNDATAIRARRFLLYSALASVAAVSLAPCVVQYSVWGHWDLVAPALHSCVEALGALAVVLMAVFLLQRRHAEPGPDPFFPALGLLGMGVLAISHASVPPGDGFVLLRSFASLVGGAFCGLVWAPAPGWGRWPRRLLPGAVLAISLALSLAVVLFPGALPAMVRDGKFAVAAVGLNLLAALGFLAASARFHAGFHRSGRLKDFSFGALTFLYGLSGLSFGYSALWDDRWWWWHFLLCVASVLALALVVREHRDTVSDLTASNRDRERAESAERELVGLTVRLEAAYRELEAFTSSVSHDLRAPLRSIHGFTEAILEDSGGKLPPEVELHFRRVQAAAARMGQLIDDLLKLSRITRAQMTREPLDLGLITREVAEELRRLEPGRDVDLVVYDNLRAEGDPRLLRVVLENLLGNAWKFTSKLPRALIEFGALDAAGERRFYVRDNGAGFDMAYAGKLFGAFQRLHALSEFPGTGIGLATVARVIHRHGGRIWAEAAQKQGATFWFTLPGDAGKGGSHGEQAGDPAGR